MLIGYARVSTADQTLEQQLDQLIKAGVERVFSEVVSGTKAMKSRPEWRRLLDTLRPGDVVVVVRLDRLGRSLHDLLNTIEDLKNSGVSLRSLSEEYGTGPMADLMMQLAGMFAQYERALNSERTKDKLAAARARGRVGGRRKSVSAPDDIAAMVSLYNDRRVSVSAIAGRFKVSRSTVYRVVSEASDKSGKSLSNNAKGEAIIREASGVARDGDISQEPPKAKKGKGPL